MCAAASQRKAGQKKELEDQLTKVIESHGHAFQYAVLNYVVEASVRESLPWHALVSEYPVPSRPSGGRLDFILQRGHGRLWLLAECKRANPAVSNWVFAKAPFVTSEWNRQSVLIEGVSKYNHGELSAGVGSWTNHPDVAHLAFELRSQQKGDRGGHGRSAIEDAVSQVLSGQSGLVESFRTHQGLLSANTSTSLVPVIFTTAELWSSNMALEQANLDDGSVAALEHALTPRAWVPYHYHISPNIRHSIQVGTQQQSLKDTLASYYMRTVFVVSPQGIVDFLRWAAAQP